MDAVRVGPQTAWPVFLPVIPTGSDILTFDVYDIYILCTSLHVQSSAPNLH